MRQVAAVLTVLIFLSTCAQAQTQWNIQTSQGLDAVAFIGPLSGDPLAKSRHIYDEDIAAFRDQMSDEAITALEIIDRTIRLEQEFIVTAALALIFSAGPAQTLDEVIESAEKPDRLRRKLEASPYWDADNWAQFRKIAPYIAIILRELKRLNFESHWARVIQPALNEKRNELQDYLAAYDIAGEASRLLGRPLDNEIDVIVANYVAPLGIRIIGQRYLTHQSYRNETVVRDAAHEMFHPPFNMENDEIWKTLAPLKSDPWFANIVENHNPVYGYNSFEAIVNEDSTKALDQIVSERLGFDEDMGGRLRKNDEGMHMLAAALYHAMKEDGFDKRGGAYETWLLQASQRGLLAPDEVRRRAAAVVGEAAAARWDP